MAWLGSVFMALLEEFNSSPFGSDSRLSSAQLRSGPAGSKLRLVWLKTRLGWVRGLARLGPELGSPRLEDAGNYVSTGFVNIHYILINVVVSHWEAIYFLPFVSTS